MIEDLKDLIVEKWNNTSVKAKLIGAAVIVVIIIAVIVN